jgi:putative YphP/YqiW family bacilliredoxin
MYPEELVRPMRAELTNHGFEELKTADQVHDMMKDSEGTTLLVVNSVCGCAAGNARPGTILSLQQGKAPNKLVTVFAGQDGEATQTARGYLAPYPPSSPSIALFKDGELVHFLERHNIESSTSGMIAADLAGAFEKYC